MKGKQSGNIASTFVGKKAPQERGPLVMPKLKMAGLRLTSLKVFFYIIKVWEELIASIKTSTLI